MTTKPNNKRLGFKQESLAVKGAPRINLNEEMDGVEVRWTFTPNPAGRHKATAEVQPGIFREIAGDHKYIVIVRSSKYPHSKLVGEISPDDVTNMPKMKRNIGILAGALTEELNERLGDNVDPDVIARNAVEAFREMMAEQRAAMLQSTA